METPWQQLCSGGNRNNCYLTRVAKRPPETVSTHSFLSIYSGRNIMKQILIRSLSLAVLASSISAFAASDPSKAASSKDEKTMTTCAPDSAASMQKADKKSMREKKKMEKKMKKDHDQKQDDYDPLLGIYG